jgi:hypothetical protein
MSFIKHKVKFELPSKITDNPAGLFAGKHCLPAGKFAVTAIGNADVLIRSHDEGQALRVQGDS